MVIVFAFQEALTPAGSPVAVPMPVAPVVVCVMLVKAELIQSVGVDEAAPAVLAGIATTCCTREYTGLQLGLLTMAR